LEKENFTRRLTACGGNVSIGGHFAVFQGTFRGDTNHYTENPKTGKRNGSIHAKNNEGVFAPK
jgi:hypothetical protein